MPRWSYGRRRRGPSSTWRCRTPNAARPARCSPQGAYELLNWLLRLFLDGAEHGVEAGPAGAARVAGVWVLVSLWTFTYFPGAELT
ncbi:hypothetical protein AB0N18_18425 [Streptomyces griseoincarnatus]